METIHKQNNLQRIGITAFLAVTALFTVCFLLIVHNLRLQNNMLEASSASYELRILLDRCNKQANLLFDPDNISSMSDRILLNVRDDFIETTERVSSSTDRLQTLITQRSQAFGSFIPRQDYQRMSQEIETINGIWGRFQARIQQIASYKASTLRAGNKYWQPVDTSIAHNSPLFNSVSNLNHLVYQASVHQNERIGFMYGMLLVASLAGVWGIWLFTLKPLGARLNASYQEIIRNNQKLDYQANHDSLTGLQNRAAFNRKVHALEAIQDNEVPWCLVLVDLDEFKAINDGLGHDMGDRVLKKVAKDLVRAPMKGEQAYRLGGDEFALLIEQVDSKIELKKRLEGLLTQLRLPLNYDERLIHSSCSLGVVVAGQSCGYSQKELFTAADTALYQVKANGRNAYRFYDEISPYSISEMIQRDDLMYEAVKNHDFKVCYQPIAETKSRTIKAFEALVYWDHPRNGRMMAKEWVEDAERLSLDSVITKQVLNTISEHFEYWQSNGMRLYPVTLSIGRSMLASGEAYDIISSINRNLPHRCLVGIEVSEPILNDRSFGQIAQQMVKFEDAGIPIIIDHYGAGQASLAQLRKIPFEAIKIDKKFTLQVSYDASARAFIDSIISITSGMDKKLICQGVQNEATRYALMELGCEFMQSRHNGNVLDYKSLMKQIRHSEKLEVA